MYKDCDFTATPYLPVHSNQIDSAPYGTGEVRKSLLRGYYAAITAMDADVGHLLENLHFLGLAEDTIVIFTSDNGMNMGHHGIWGKGNGTFPFNMYDTAVKVPFLISWPGHYKEGNVCHRMCSQYDVFQTLLDMLDIKKELPDCLPGKSFADVFTGNEHSGGSIVVYDEFGSTRMIRTREWKYICRTLYGSYELYHLTEDPDEHQNLVGNLAYKADINSLYTQLTRWFYTYADPAVDAAREGVSGHGQLCRPGIYADRRHVFY